MSDVRVRLTRFVDFVIKTTMGDRSAMPGKRVGRCPSAKRGILDGIGMPCCPVR